MSPLQTGICCHRSLRWAVSYARSSVPSCPSGAGGGGRAGEWADAGEESDNHPEWHTCIRAMIVCLVALRKMCRNGRERCWSV